MENNKNMTTSMNARINIEGQEIDVIIDSGAGPNVISNKLRKRLNIAIAEPSKERCTLANGETVASLGKAEVIMYIDDELEIPIIVEVIDSGKEEMIIGNDALGEWKTKIDYEKELVIIEYNEEQIEIPVKYIIERNNNKYKNELEEEQENVENEEIEFNEEYEVESDYDYEEGDKRSLYTVIRGNEKIEEAKEIVLAQRRERQ
jgi:hypothetical protein